MDHNGSFYTSGEDFKPRTDEEFDYESEYRNIVTPKGNPYADPDEAEVFNNKILYAMYFFTALLAFCFLYACCTCYYLWKKQQIEEHNRVRREREENRREWAIPLSRRFNPFQRRSEEKARQDPSRLSEFVFGRDMPEQNRVKMEDRRPTSMVLDDNSSDGELKGATGISKSFLELKHLEDPIERENMQDSLENERLFHELTPSERPEKWRLREAFPSYFETIERIFYPEDFQGILNPNAMAEPTNQYPTERHQKIFTTRDAILRARAVQESKEMDRLKYDSQENTSLCAASSRTSTPITGYKRQRVRPKLTHSSYDPPEAKERKFFPEDVEDLLCPSKSPENATSNDGATGESSRDVQSETSNKAYGKQKQDRSPVRDTNMNSLLLENLEMKPKTSPNRLVQSSPPSHILRRQGHSKRNSQRRTSS